MSSNIILRKPIFTEKSLKEAALRRYTFAVGRGANKTDIKKAIEETFGVKVKAIKTITVPGKTHRIGKKGLHKTEPKWKKAIAELKDGDKIDLFETGGEKHGA